MYNVFLFYFNYKQQVCDDLSGYKNTAAAREI